MHAPDAPEFPHDFAWIHTSKPLTLAHDLQGQVVLLCFWAPHEAHTPRALDDVAWLEQQFVMRPFAALSVLSGRDRNEERDAVAAAALARFSPQHPVLRDKGCRVFDDFGCTAWPSFVLVDARGHVRARAAGTTRRDRMFAAIESLLAEAVDIGHASGRPARWPDVPLAGGWDAYPVDPAGLAAPGGLAYDADRSLLWVADTGHHRVLGLAPESDGSYRLLHVVGTGLPGASDGAFEAATFFRPRGLAVVEDRVFVADEGNHLLRAIDPDSRHVEAVLGNALFEPDFVGGERGFDQGLQGPAGIAWHGETLYLTCPPNRQVWWADAYSYEAAALAGTGHMEKRATSHDGPAAHTHFNSPSGIAADGDTLFVCDEGAGLVRCVDLVRHRVSTCLSRKPQAQDASNAASSAEALTTGAVLSNDVGVEPDGVASEPEVKVSPVLDPMEFDAPQSVVVLGGARPRRANQSNGPNDAATPDADPAPSMPLDAADEPPRDLLIADGLAGRVVRCVRETGETVALLDGNHGISYPTALAMLPAACGMPVRLLLTDGAKGRLLQVELPPGFEAPNSTIRDELHATVVGLADLPAAGGAVPRKTEPVTCSARSAVTFVVTLPLDEDVEVAAGAPVAMQLHNDEGDICPVPVDDVAAVEGCVVRVGPFPTGDVGAGVVRLTLSFLTAVRAGGVTHRHMLQWRVPCTLTTNGPTEVQLTDS